MPVAVAAGLPWDGVAEFTKAAQEKRCDPAVWVAHVSSVLAAAGAPRPSPELSHLLVSHLCWGNNVPLAWKYVERALAANLASPMLLLALLSTRVIPSRHSRPAAYRLYMELLRRHAFSFASQINGSNFKNCSQCEDKYSISLNDTIGYFLYTKLVIMASIDDVLHLSRTFGIQACEPGVLVVEYVFFIVWQLLDATLDDEGLLELIPDKKSKWAARPQDMEIDGEGICDEKRNEHNEKLQKINSVMAIELIAHFLQHKVTSSLLSLACGNIYSALWIPIDLYLEDCIDLSVAATNAIEILSGLVKALQAANGTNWHDAFLGLWMASLRLVQREREPHEGPVPHLDTRLCMLLSITTLSIADIIEEEEVSLIDEAENNNQWREKAVGGKRRKELVSSLQVLGDYATLLVPPPSVISAANQAAAKAMMFVSGLPVGSGCLESMNLHDKTINCKLEKIFEIAISGSDDDKVSAATILCGASLIRGWNIQEHAVRFVVKLLSPPVPVDYSGSESHLISHSPMLNVVLTGISCVDCVQVFSFHGLVPELAGALMAICEVFGSCVPSVSWTLSTGEEITAHSVFSNAFILLLRLWKFNHPPLEYCIMGDGAPVGSQLTPEYLLLLRNAKILSPSNVTKNRNSQRRLPASISSSSMHPIFVDSFPKLKIWYRQHQACLASTLSGLVHGTPVHQNVDALLNMMFRKIKRGTNQSIGSGTSGSSSLSSSSGPGSDDSSVRPKLPAWDIMEAVPFVVDAALTACSHGKLSPRELATGLKDLADFLPASLATIVSYFSAEVTRGVWKPAFMNGTDWPSPAANLSTVEENIKKIVAATGVDVPSLVAGGSSPAALPLPLAAFVSLTITYKLDKASERFLNLAGPALESLAASCPWPSMPIVAALWTQKVKRWTDFLTFSASRTVFHHNNDAVVQLLRSCFTATLGLSPSPISSNGGVGGLLGHGFGSHFTGGLSPVAPGVLYLRVYRCIKDIILLTEEILSLLMLSVKEIAVSIVSKERSDKLKKTRYGMRYGQVSFASAMKRVEVAAALGATLVWLSGGSGLIQSLIQEMLPSWFLSVHDLDQEGGTGGIVYKLGGYALAYFTVLSGMFAWGINSTPVSKRRPRVIESHMEFIASALDGKISLGCDWALWRAYVSGFLGLVVECAPCWVLEVELEVLKRLSRGLRQWNEEDLALALLQMGNVEAMGAAAEMILANE
ncbi:Mediator of RNA polymerase II transcription subunit 33B [Cocos nucifera]|uniref:Mediator of RNA polymerase II transcription subunit 33B n=1 Tax=Cocos nucifera TaxID=13894 RepID=A0A8K0N0C2_COCNU|nr:Mediator of RNA polymerase II transcription subunit 33B [Cocos nucifera]